MSLSISGILLDPFTLLFLLGPFDTSRAGILEMDHRTRYHISAGDHVQDDFESGRTRQDNNIGRRRPPIKVSSYSRGFSLKHVIVCQRNVTRVNFHFPPE